MFELKTFQRTRRLMFIKTLTTRHFYRSFHDSNFSLLSGTEVHSHVAFAKLKKQRQGRLAFLYRADKSVFCQKYSLALQFLSRHQCNIAERDQSLTTEE